MHRREDIRIGFAGRMQGGVGIVRDNKGMGSLAFGYEFSLYRWEVRGEGEGEGEEDEDEDI